VSYQNVLIERRERVGILTLNRPDKLNSFGVAMAAEIADALDELAGDSSVAAIILTGAGRAFCAGGDVEFMSGLLQRNDRDAMHDLVESGRRIIMTIRGTPKPVIGSINGIAAGGGANLALACDMRIASEDAKLAQSFNRIGLHPDWGGTFFLPRLVGEARALELFWSGETLDSAECLRLGLFNRVVPGGVLADTSFAFARGLALKAQLPIGLVKRAVYQSLDRTASEMLDYELEAQMRCADSPDAAEGLRAFVEKRPAQFGGQNRVPRSSPA
jgi:2-(1,2-epoxy-1,2-dihydrophenyl)acetyl-CoA isomerase